MITNATTITDATTSGKGLKVAELAVAWNQRAIDDQRRRSKSSEQPAPSDRGFDGDTLWRAFPFVDAAPNDRIAREALPVIAGSTVLNEVSQTQ
jgi:hypothetical protein